ncbi:MAG: multifunctional CCA addition/repair protein [Gammaproteobacteria bacterium]|nr:multifunctional CCA addition/repair protein [Gammaproteobacteria bacterium]
MEVYLVGGAVRDELLGLPVHERDWCVVGATPEEMTAAGYRPVGKDFPVFLHPDTGEEYALARTERKTGAGYHGFRFHTSSDVTIEQDLARRDLTINAMARDGDGELVDPFNGNEDLNQRTLRHVSDAFTEDPVRILRVARFAARFGSLGFSIAEETLHLMNDMVQSGEVDALVADRVWKETEKALGETDPHVFFDVLKSCDALRVVFPEIDALFGVPQPEEWHPEIDCGIHTMMVVEQAARLSEALDVRFAALVHDLGKATTRKSDLPRHPGHERRSIKLVKSLAKRLPIPNDCRDLGLLAAEFHTHCHRALELRSSTVLKVLDRTDAFRRPERFERFLLACEADSRGRKGLEDREYPQADYFRGAHRAATNIDIADLNSGELEGAEIGREIGKRRLDAIRRFKQNYVPPK